jgi:hypothetical protein
MLRRDVELAQQALSGSEFDTGYVGSMVGDFKLRNSLSSAVGT